MGNVQLGILLCAFAVRLLFNARVRGEEEPPSRLELPALLAAQGAGHQEAAALIASGNYAAAEARLLAMIERIPHDAQAHYNLACVLARQEKAAEALAALETAVRLGFRDPEHIEGDEDLAALRDDKRFAAALEAAAAPLAEAPGWRYDVKAAAPEEGQVVVSEENLAYNPQLGAYAVTVEFGDAPAEKPIAVGLGEAGDLLRRWDEEGTAAGNHGDLYDNHDRDHSNMNVSTLPQLTRVEFADAIRAKSFDHGLQRFFIYSRPTFGNSSTAITSGPIWRSQGRLAITRPGGAAFLYLQYRANQLYLYPEHRDHDEGHNGEGGGYGDVLPANTPYLILSQGSSGSDRVFLTALGAALAAFRPEVKEKLAKSGLLMPALQMIFRMSNKQVAETADYLTGKAHPSVFDGNQLDMAKMVTMAHEMTADSLPPLAQLKVVEEDESLPGRDYFDAAPREKLFDTPGAIARVHKSTSFERRMVVSAEESADLDGRPLTYHWAVLRGDAERIRINKLNEAGSRVELIVPYHERRPISPESKMESNRVDIGAFVKCGNDYSAPAFVSVYYLDNEQRVYSDEGRILSVDYTDPKSAGNYVDPLLDARKDWRDEYRYSDEGSLLGWTRIRGDKREEFTPEGRLIVERDDDGQPAKTAEVRYVIRQQRGGPPTLQQQSDGPGER